MEAGPQPLRPRRDSSSRLRIDPPDLPGAPPYPLKPGLPIPGWSSLLRPPLAIRASTGLLTGFPSTTPFGLALGADSPCADERCAGNLGLSACGPFTRIIVTHVSIRTSDTSRAPYRAPSPAYRTLPYQIPPTPPLTKGGWGGFPQLRYTASSPGESSAQADSTSELLRFL